MPIENDLGISRLREFHQAFDLPRPSRPTLPDLSPADALRLGLYVRDLAAMASELKVDAAVVNAEGRRALGLCLVRLQLTVEECAETFDAVSRGDPVGVLDGLADSSYVNDGNYLSFGMGYLKVEACEEVHRSNMSKLGEDGRPIVSPAGRVEKGPRYSPPDLARLLRGAGGSRRSSGDAA